MQEPPLRALLIESSAVARTAIQFQLEQLGYSVEAAGGDTELSAIIERPKFDLLLIDAQMDAEVGCSSFPAFRESVPTIVLLSELDPPEARMRFKNYLVKPFQREALAKALAAVRMKDAPASLVQADDLLTRLGGNREVLKQMAELLRKQADAWRAEIRTALAQRNGEALRRLAHQAKGSLANLSAPQAAAAAQQLEDIASQGQWEGADAALSKLELMAEQVARELAAM
ncbi:MAG TPA: Hpt domain-containing protein [Gemmataceae bacterium]|nr:Hpt domain-containing protein [Gemmataceae bacterium]